MDRWAVLVQLVFVAYVFGGCAADIHDLSRVTYVDGALTGEALKEYGLVQLPSGARPDLERYSAMVDTALARRLESGAADFLRSGLSVTESRVDGSPELADCHRNVVRSYLTGGQVTPDELSCLASELGGRYLLIVYVEGFGFKPAGSSQAFMPIYPPRGTNLDAGTKIQEGMAAVAVIYDGMLGRKVWERNCEVASTFVEGGLKKPYWKTEEYLFPLVCGIVESLPR